MAKEICAIRHLFKASDVKLLKRVSDAVGLVYLASFVMNTGLLWFFMRASVICNFIDRGIVYVYCGQGPMARFLDVFFLYFSPLVTQIMRGNVNRLFYDPDPLSEAEFWPVILFFILSWTVLVCCILTLRTIVRGMIRRKAHPAGYRHAKLMLAVIIVPALVGYSVRFYVKPPKFVNREITVDIWRGKFVAPRGILDDWSLVTPERLPFKPDDYASVLTRKWKWVPYIEFDFPDNVPMRTMRGASAIHINPHYERLEGEKMTAARAKSAELKLRKITADTSIPAYPPVEPKTGKWEIHAASPDIHDYFPDVYLWRDDKGHIERILECTPARYCALVTPFKWINYYCEAGQDCAPCQKICTERSLGAADYDVTYSFDRRYLDKYPEIHDKIMKYVARFYVPE